jgi:hypothetical protein
MANANYTLSNFNGVSDEARRAVLVVSGTNAAIRDVIAPLVTKVYTIKNNTTGGFAINIRAASGSSVSIPNGVTSAVYCDGTNFNLALTQTLVAAGAGISISTVGATSTITNTNDFVSGTRLSFPQAAAPTGWTQDITDNATNRMLRVVNTAGNGVGGSDSPIVNSTTMVAHTHTFTGSALAAHTHTDSGHLHVDTGSAPAFNATSGPDSKQQWTGTHNTQIGYANISSNSAGTPAGTNSTTTGVSWTPRYIDLIICSKN